MTEKTKKAKRKGGAQGVGAKKESERHNGISYEKARWTDREQREINNRNDYWGGRTHLEQYFFTVWVIVQVGAQKDSN